MVKGKSKAEKERDERRRQRFWKYAVSIVERWLRTKFDFSHDDFDPGAIDGPVLVAINHASAYDPIFVGVAFRKKRLTYIASEHILRVPKWGALIDKYFSIIPHQKGAKGSRTALVAMKRIKRGESVFLAVEGEQTWNGRPLPVMPYTGKLVKGSSATLVTYMIEGAYLSAPRWSFETRKGKVYGHPVKVYGPEELSVMSDQDVEAAIARDLAFDIWQWQKDRPDGPVRYKCKGGSADGLERSVFACPECGAMGTLRSDGDIISCSCGFRLRLEDTGFFEQPSPFETVCDWEESDRKILSERMAGIRSGADEGTVVFSDEEVTLVKINEGHEEEEIAHGTLSLCYNNEDFALDIGDRRFSLKDISSMTMALAARVVFSDSSGYYELRSKKESRTNLRKYVIARKLVEECAKDEQSL